MLFDFIRDDLLIIRVFPFQDSVYVLASAINEYQKVAQVIEAPKDCDDSGALWDSGKQIFQYLKTINIRGETGQVAFDDNGDRIYAEYEVINVLDDQKKKVVGNFYYDEVCIIAFPSLGLPVFNFTSIFLKLA